VELAPTRHRNAERQRRVILAAVFLVGLAAGAAGCYVLQRPALEYLKAELNWARAEIVSATDRLLYSWKNDGVTPAPRPLELGPLPDKLPSELQDVVDQWESPESRAAVDQRIRAMLSRGWDPVKIILELDKPRI